MNAVSPLSRFTAPIRATNADPLVATRYDVEIRGGMATVSIARSFENREGLPIEAVLVFPVPTIAVATGLRARIGDRELVATAQAVGQARRTYEDAVDEGKATVLHTEVLKGLHQVSVANVAPGAKVVATLDYVMPLSFDPEPTLSIPTTVAEVYGRWNVEEVDRPTAGDVEHRATVSVRVAQGGGTPSIAGVAGTEADVALDRPIEIVLAGHDASPATGRLADGREVTISIRPIAKEERERSLDLSLLTDRSGSMAEPRHRPVARLVESAYGMLSSFIAGDRLRHYAFDDVCELLGEAQGDAIANLVRTVPKPRDGTKIGRALSTVFADPKAGRDVLIVTDGRSNDLDYDRTAAEGKRIHVLLIGERALDAGVSQIAARTGGHVMVTSGDNVLSALETALAASCLPGDEMITEKERIVMTILRGGAVLRVEIAAGGRKGERKPEGIGAFAAAMLADRLSREDAVALSVDNGIAGVHTSLVLVDHEGAAQTSTPVSRKSNLMRSHDAGATMSWSASGVQDMGSMSLSQSSAKGASLSAGPGETARSGRMAKVGDPGSARMGSAPVLYRRPLTPEERRSIDAYERHVVGRVVPAPGSGPASPDPIRHPIGVDPRSVVMPNIGGGKTRSMSRVVQALSILGLDWSMVSVDVGTLDIHGVPDGIAETLDRDAARLTALTGGDARKGRLLALAVAAEAGNDRAAARIARRVRAALGDAAMDEARRLLGSSVAA